MDPTPAPTDIAATSSRGCEPQNVPDGLLCGIVLDSCGTTGHAKIYECYCFELRECVLLRTEQGLCKSWEVVFSIKCKDDNGVCDVSIVRFSANSPSLAKRDVVLRRDGVVIMKTYVGASKCVQHESYEGKVLWSDKFGRVFYSAEEKDLTKLVIYSTYVQRDVSDAATSIGVAFSICDVLKRVDDEVVVKRCREQMLKDQDRILAATVCTDEKNDKYGGPDVVLGQKGFSSYDGPYSARVYGDDKPQRRKQFRFRKGSAMSPSSNQFDENDLFPPLMLCVRADSRGTRAWSVKFGTIPVEEAFVRQTGLPLKKGDWFYGNIRRCSKGSKQFFYVKKVDRPADPLAYTYCMNNSLQIELLCYGGLVEELPNGKAILGHPHVGSIKIARKDYDQISSQRMIGLLRFDETNGNVPWTLVGFIRKLESGEEFPLLSPECLISDSVRRDDAIRKASHDDPQTYKKGPHHQYRSH